MTTVSTTSRQPSFTMPWQERHSRLTTFFRWLLAIPPVLWLCLWSLTLIVTVPVTWVALLFSGRYPEALYDFHASLARYSTHVYGYMYLATDRWPGFSGDPSVDHPVRLGVGPPLAAYDRVKVLLRILFVIPVLLIAYAMNIVAQIAAFVAWFAIVFTGRLPQGIYQMLNLGLSYQQRALPYYLLLTEDWPAFTTPADRAALSAPPPPGIPPPAAAPAPAPARPHAAPDPPQRETPGPTGLTSPPREGRPPNLGDFRPPSPPDDAA